MRRSQVLILATALVVGACGEPASLAAEDSSTTTAAPDLEPLESTTTSTIGTTTKTETLETTSTTTEAADTTTPTTAPQPNRPPVIEDVGASLSIDVSRDKFSLVVDPVATDPDGDVLEFKASVSGDPRLDLTPPLMMNLTLDTVLNAGGVTVSLSASDGELTTELDQTLDLTGLEVVGTVSDLTFEVTNPGACFFALGPGGATAVTREVELELWYPGRNGPDFEGTVSLSKETPLVMLPGFESRTWHWSDDLSPTHDRVYANYHVMKLSTNGALDVPFENPSKRYADGFTRHLCDLQLSGVADFNLRLDP